MKDYPDSAMIALLPTQTDWCYIKLPHLTLVYAGELDNLQSSDFNKLAKDASSLSMITKPLVLPILTRERFGNWSKDPDDAVDVFRVAATQELLAMRNFVEDWNASEFPFNPHVTIGPVGSVVEDPPKMLMFDRILVGWGEEQLTFWLRR